MATKKNGEAATPESEAADAESATLESSPVRARTVPASPKGLAVSRKGVDDVLATVGEGSNKSLSAHHVQRRLVERGYAKDVYRDRDGFWRAGTTAALEAFKRDESFDSEATHRQVLEALFENDENVRVVD